MGNAEQYANWIVQNEGKRGTPEFETVVQAYKAARETPQDAPVAGSKPVTLRDVGEAALQGAKFGPIGSASAVTGLHMDRAAHRAGEGVSQALAPYVPGEVAGGAGYLANVGMQAIPTVLGGGIGRMAAPLLEKGGEALMRMALKPSTTLSPEKSAAAVRQMLTGNAGNFVPGANVTSGGIGQIQGKIKDLGSKADELVDQSGALASRSAIASATDKSRSKFGPATVANKGQANPEADLAAIQKVEDEFLRNYQSMMPIRQAQNLKQGTYRALGDKAYKGELKAAETEAQKDIAGGARAEIEKAIPEVAPINAEQSRWINAVKAAISRDAIAANKDPIGLGFLAANPAAAAAFMASRSELVKSQLARLLYNYAKPATTAAGATAGGLLGEKAGRQE